MYIIDPMALMQFLQGQQAVLVLLLYIAPQ